MIKAEGRGPVARRQVAALVLALICAVAARAQGLSQPPAQDVDGQIQRLLDVTGTTRQLEQLAGMMSALFDQNRGAYDAKTYSVVDGIIKEQFGRLALLEAVKRQLKKDFDPRLCDALLRAYASELFLRITETEVSNGSPEFLAKADAFDYSAIGPERDRIFDAFLADSRYFEQTEAMVTESLKAFFTTFNIALPEGRKIPATTIAAVLENVKAQSGSKAERDKEKRHLALMYADYSDAELTAYFGMYTTEAGRWFTESMIGGISRAFVECMMNTANEIKNRLGIAEGKA